MVDELQEEDFIVHASIGTEGQQRNKGAQRELEQEAKEASKKGKPKPKPSSTTSPKVQPAEAAGATVDAKPKAKVKGDADSRTAAGREGIHWQACWERGTALICPEPIQSHVAQR